MLEPATRAQGQTGSLQPAASKQSEESTLRCTSGKTLENNFSVNTPIAEGGLLGRQGP